MENLFSGIEHVAISARSPERLAQWYVSTLGFEIFTSFDNGPGKPKTYIIRLGEQPLLVEISPADPDLLSRERQNGEAGLTHFAIVVTDFERAHQRLFYTDARPEGEERAGPRNSRIHFYRDPEGNLFHILWRPQPLEP